MVWTMVISGLKFIFGIGFALGSGMGFLQTVLFCTAGGMLGVFFFATIYKGIMRVIFGEKIKPLKVKFSSQRRRLVRFRKKFGLAGIAFLTPLILQVPIGTIIAMHLIKDLRKVSLYMFVSFMFYSVIIAALYFWTGIDLPGMLTNLKDRIF